MFYVSNKDLSVDGRLLRHKPPRNDISLQCHYERAPFASEAISTKVIEYQYMEWLLMFCSIMVESTTINNMPRLYPYYSIGQEEECHINPLISIIKLFA